MSCSCNDKDLDFCHKPKVSDWQLNIVRRMIKCLCKCGDNPTGDDTLTLESYAILEVLTDPLP